MAQGKTTKVSFKSSVTVTNPREDWLVVKDTHEPLVTKEQFDMASRRSHQRTCEQKGQFHNLFSGVARCADCGRGMSTVGTRKKGAAANLACGGYKLYGRGECSNHFIDHDTLCELVLSAMKHMTWKRRTLLFLISQSVTLFGSTLTQMAIVWYVTLQTSSGSWVSAFTICSYLPQFLVSFVGGVWADRYSRKTLIIAADALIAAFTLALILLMPRIGEGDGLLAALLGVSLLRSMAAGVQTPAVNAALPALVPEEKLMRYNGINAAMQSAMQFAAPAAAGALLTVSTLGSALMVDVATAAVGIGLLSLVLIPASEEKPEQKAVLEDMRQGLRYTFSDGFLRRLLMVYGLFILLSIPGGFLASLYVTRTFGESYAYMTAVELVGFAGMTAGGALMGAWGGFKSRVKTLLVGLAAFGATSIGMGLAPGFVFYLALMLLCGVALTMVQTACTTLLQERAAPEYQGRVFGLLGSAYCGFLPLGMAIFGPLADAVPLGALMVVTGVMLAGLAGVMRMDKRFT